LSGRRRSKRQWAFGLVLCALLTVATLVGIEVMASAFVPSWPARAMVPRLPWEPRTLAAPFRQQPWLADPDNSWGMRDRERSFDKPPGVYRSVFIGDSFVESRFTPKSLPALVQQKLDPEEKRLEAINFGVSATGPREYFYRLRDVAMRLRPTPCWSSSTQATTFSCAARTSPVPSVSSMPRRAAPFSRRSCRVRTGCWPIGSDFHRFFGSATQAPPDEAEQLFDIVSGPREQRQQRLVAYVRKWLQPKSSDEEVAEILGRGNAAYLDVAEPGVTADQEYLLDWMLRILMNWESGAILGPRNEAEIREMAGRGYIPATLSWLSAMNREAQAQGVPILFFAIPVGSVDPDYARFWQSWPLTDTWNRFLRGAASTIGRRCRPRTTAADRSRSGPRRNPWHLSQARRPLDPARRGPRCRSRGPRTRAPHGSTYTIAVVRALAEFDSLYGSARKLQKQPVTSTGAPPEALEAGSGAE
jgi:hypothetical protein